MTTRERFDSQTYVTINEYASKLRVSERTVRTWAKKGAIPVKRIGRTVRILISFSRPPEIDGK